MARSKKPAQQTKKQAPRELTRRQRRFVDLLVLDPLMRQGKAALDAGYGNGNPESADQHASRLVKNRQVQAAIDEAFADRAKRFPKLEQRVIAELSRIAFADLGDAYDDDGSLLKPRKIPEELRRAMTGIDVDEIWEGYGDDRTQIGETKKLRLADKTRALELLGKYLKILTDKHEVTGKDGGPIKLEDLVAGAGKAQAK
jgi:phage terminase small subunit